uniref:G-protein coupled receptors family 1 profile domain-containing protein n=1 Tax=Strigamia maritima TaxID=126957 RepID=T1J7U8_STRMM
MHNLHFTIPFCAQTFTSGVLTFLVLWTLVGFHYNRYLAVSIPFHYVHVINRKRVLIFLIFQWICGVLLTLPLVAIEKLELISWTWYNAVYASGALCLPIIVIIICNVRCFLIARFHRHRIISALYEVSVRAQAAITPNQKSSPYYLHQFKGSCEIIKCLCPLIFLYTPLFVIFVAESGSLFVPMEIRVMSNILFCSAPVCHGLMYGICSKILKKKLKEILNRQLYQSEVNIEAIQRQSSVNRSSLRTAKTQHVILRFMQET